MGLIQSAHTLRHSDILSELLLSLLEWGRLLYADDVWLSSLWVPQDVGWPACETPLAELCRCKSNREQEQSVSHTDARCRRLCSNLQPRRLNQSRPLAGSLRQIYWSARVLKPSLQPRICKSAAAEIIFTTHMIKYDETNTQRHFRYLLQPNI